MKLAIGIARGESVHWPVIDCLDKLKADLTSHGIWWLTMMASENDPHRQYEAIVDEMLSTEDTTHLLLLGRNTVFAPQTARHLLALDLPVVSGVCFQTKWPHEPVLYRWIPSKKKALSLAKELGEWCDDHAIAGTEQPTILDLPEDGNVWDIDACSFNCLLMRREVLEAIETPRFVGDMAYSVDIIFCNKLRKANIPIMADLRVQLGSLVESKITVNDFCKIEEWNPVI